MRAVEVPPVRITADVTDDELLGRLGAAIAAAIGTAVSDTEPAGGVRPVPLPGPRGARRRRVPGPR